jgi:hypothetical protein
LATFWRAITLFPSPSISFATTLSRTFSSLLHRLPQP